MSCVALDNLPDLFVPLVSFLENEDDNTSLAIYLEGILAEQMSLCSVYEVLRGEMLAECKIGLHCSESHHPFPTPDHTLHGRGCPCCF